MPLPPVELEWQFDVGRDLGPRLDISANERVNAIMLAIKNRYIAFAVKPWVVWGCSNAVTAGIDQVDRWASASDVVWNHSSDNASVVPRSWMLLKNAAGLYLLLDCISDPTDLRFFLSKDGFTGGSITARPTAPDEAFFGGTDPLGFPSTLWILNFDTYGSVVNRMHILHSMDGRNTYTFFTGLGAGSVSGTSVTGQAYEGAWLIGELADAPGALTKPFFGMLDRVGLTGAMWDNTWYSRAGCFLPGGAALATVQAEHSYPLPTTDGNAFLGVGTALNAANQISGEWPMQPMRIYEPVSGACLGRMRDIWFGAGAAPGGPVSGTTYPDGGPSVLASFGPFVVPWPSSLGRPLVGMDSILYLSKTPSVGTYGLPTPVPHASSGFTAPIVLTFNDVLDPSTVVFDYKRQDTLPAMADYNPASTVRVWIRAPGGPALVPTLEVAGTQLKVHNTGDGPADTWQTPGGNAMDVRVYLTSGIQSISGVALTPPVVLPAAAVHYAFQDDDS
jgi:hypothetical protein